MKSAFDFIKTDLSIGDISNNMCVITITNDSNQKRKGFFHYVGNVFETDEWRVEK